MTSKSNHFTSYSKFEGYELVEWHPTENPEDSPAQQVHFFINMPEFLKDVMPRIALRFKGPIEMRRLIQLMIWYYEDVWGRVPEGWKAVRPPEGGDIEYRE